MRTGVLWLWAAAIAAGVPAGAGCRKKAEPPPEPAATRPAREPSEPTRQAEPVRREYWQRGKTYLCRRARGNISIDSQGPPGQWAHAVVVRDFLIPVTGMTVTSTTDARMLWDDEHLYLYFFARDRDIRGKFTKPTDPLWEEDSIDWFFKPRANKPFYYQVQVNALGAVSAWEIAARRSGAGRQLAELQPPVRSAVNVLGTLNDDRDRDTYYRGVIAVPWKLMKLIGGRAPKAGETWTFNVCRSDYSGPAGLTVEEQAAAKLTTQDYHHYEEYVPLKFVE
ncbi:hypothetical protein LCGC14_1810360, partial [marine sediment metagenome]